MVALAYRPQGVDAELLEFPASSVGLGTTLERPDLQAGLD